MRTLLLAALAIALGACENPSAPRMETAADSLALRITEGAGGLEAWDALPGIAFEWAVVLDSTEVVRNLHVWDKRGDRARTEWRGGEDSVFVGVISPSAFDPDAPSGRAALNGEALSGADLADALTGAHSRFVNDSYWLVAPLKVFDPGVRRDLDEASGFPRLAIAFDSVGLTPGDRYWIETDGVTGAMVGWQYVLQSGREGDWAWVEPARLATDAGPVILSRMKVSADGQTVILTEPTALLTIDEADFEDLTPRLAPR